MGAMSIFAWLGLICLLVGADIGWRILTHKDW